jgi:hypothetical protein
MSYFQQTAGFSARVHRCGRPRRTDPRGPQCASRRSTQALRPLKAPDPRQGAVPTQARRRQRTASRATLPHPEPPSRPKPGTQRDAPPLPHRTGCQPDERSADKQARSGSGDRPDDDRRNAQAGRSDDRHGGPASDEDLSVRVELTIVDGPEAAAWRSRQAAAIQALLEWVAVQPNDGHREQDQTRVSGKATERRTGDRAKDSRP